MVDLRYLRRSHQVEDEPLRALGVLNRIDNLAFDSAEARLQLAHDLPS